MKRVLGYSISGIGIIGLLLSFNKIRELTKIQLLNSITPMQIIIVSLILIAIGAFMVYKGKSKKSEPEVPIYHGEKIIGYRRH